MSINEVKQVVDYIVRKNNSGYLTPDQFNLIINRAQITIFVRKYGSEEDYMPGKPIPRMAFEQTQSVSDDLRKFKEPADLIVDRDGRANYPEGYIHTLSLGYVGGINVSGSIQKNYYPIEVVDQDKEFYRLSSVVVPPTKKFPIAVIKNTYFQFYPTNVGVVKLSYLRLPRNANWGYTLVSNRPVFAATGGVNGNSVDLEWPGTNINEIITEALTYIGISIKDKDVIQYANQKAQEGI